jgi:hypothetical protein
MPLINQDTQPLSGSILAARCEPGSSSTAGEEEARGARPVEPFTAPRAMASEGWSCVSYVDGWGN